jgi:glycosyltransferase involved in cell wall biosynthesis
VDGDLVPPGNVGALADSLNRSLADPDGSFQMGVAARRKVEASFSPPDHLARLDEVYREAMALAGRS